MAEQQLTDQPIAVPAQKSPDSPEIPVQVQPENLQQVVGKKNTLNHNDWMQWAKETIIYNLIPPAVVALNMLYAAATQGHFLPTGPEMTLIIGGFYTSFLASLINLLGKYKSGV